MEWLTPFFFINLIGIGANLDNAGVGIAYGVERIRIPHVVILIVNVLGFATAMIGGYAGTAISPYFSPFSAKVLSSFIFVSYGLYIGYANYIYPKISYDKKPIKFSKPGLKQALLLGFGLSFTNLAGGIGVSISGIASIWPAAISITIWGYLTIWLGNICGNGFLANVLGRFSPLFATMIFLFIGVYCLL